MDKIKLKRGTETVTYRKDDRNFAIKLQQGMATDEAALEAACNRPSTGVRHIESVPTERMDIFAVDDPTVLEETMDELRDTSASDVVTHMYTIDDSGATVIPTGTMTIQFEPDVSDEDREAVFEEFGLEILEELDFLDHGYTVRLTGASTENPLKIAAKLQSRDGIVTAEPDLSFEIMSQYVPDEPLYPNQWHLNNDGGGAGFVAGADVDAEAAWEYTRGIREITVCVVDQGFDLDHPDFDAPGKVVAPHDFSGRDFDPSPGFEEEAHGTACAGVAVAEENGSGVVGLAPGCSLMPVQIGRISDEDLRKLFQYTIDEGADVVSCSWRAKPLFDPLSTKADAIIREAATQGRDGKGCVILFAAGNDDSPLKGEKDGRPIHLGFALHPNVIAVGASNSMDERSGYSNFGPELTLCAPSSGAPGHPITTTDRRGSVGYSPDDYTNGFGGTSSATPLAAGPAALILSVRPEYSASEVRQIMTNTADKIDTKGGDYDENGHSPLYGHGRINAHRALAMAVGEGGDGERLPKKLSMEHEVNEPISDQGETSDAIPFPLDVTPTDVEVSVAIEHTWRGDLRVTLTTPTGGDVVLADRSGGREDDLVQTYRLSDDPDRFSDVLGGSAEGEWRLTVADIAPEDVGTLVKWGVAISYAAEE